MLTLLGPSNHPLLAAVAAAVAASSSSFSRLRSRRTSSRAPLHQPTSSYPVRARGCSPLVRAEQRAARERRPSLFPSFRGSDNERVGKPRDAEKLLRSLSLVPAQPGESGELPGGSEASVGACVAPGLLPLAACATGGRATARRPTLERRRGRRSDGRVPKVSETAGPQRYLTRGHLESLRVDRPATTALSSSSRRGTREAP